MPKLDIATRRAFYALLYLAAAYGLLVFSLWLAKQLKAVAIPTVVAEFVCFLIIVLGMLNLYFGSYQEIPGVAWVIMMMLLLAGLIFGVGMLFV